MYFKCFTLNKEGIKEGIPVDEYECIIADTKAKTIKTADLKLVPVLPYTQPTLEHTAHLSLAFLKEADEATEISPGIILSVDPYAWRICMSLTNLTLLDPCGFTGYVLLFIPPESPNVLISADKTMRVFGTNKSGEPEIRVTNRAASMLQAIGINVKDLFPDYELPARPKAAICGRGKRMRTPGLKRKLTPPPNSPDSTLT